ncbi:retropepsin-like domain-containing protein [Methylocystis sp. WRRC1]|uniref:retropepsin-like aspartic protease n=1 Tax=Methylocystis sp. WRRC1 TaxID=1732014 RepID=UPI001D156E40|nr:retropepsin-like aspartic protease [Methylocystis sp. WRRC1]MCC3245970.1 retropepsin-like domain-containing protein [Methylocystis sp. WRRC1]
MRFFRALLLFILTVGAHGAGAQTSRSVVSMTLTQGDYGGGRVYLPMRFDKVMGTMRLDTGASTTRIALAPWNKDLPAMGASESTGASGLTIRCDDVEARNVALKAVQGNDIARAKYEVTRCPTSDGGDLLGLDFFKNALFTLDFDHREMVFFGAPLSTGHARPFRMLGPDRRLVGVELRVGNVTSVGLFDTGAEICAVDQSFVRKHKKLFTLEKAAGKASEAGGKKFASKIYRIREIDLGDGRVARDVHALAYDFGPLRAALGKETPFILGYNLLSRFTWELDLRAPDRPMWDARGR